MKLMTVPSISFDRLSTREELVEVLHLLTDATQIQSSGITGFNATDPELACLRAEFAQDVNRSSEQESESGDDSLITVLLEADEPIN